MLKLRGKNNEYMREYMKTRRATKNPETNEKNNEYMKTRRATKNPEKKEKNYEYMREYMKTKRTNKNTETKEKNNEYMREYMKTRRATKNPETKEKNNEYMREYMKTKRTNENTETKEKNNEYMRDYMKTKRANKNPEIQKENYNKYMRRYRKQKQSNTRTMEDLIKMFHGIVSNGPLYVCSCCDQLWYKHSVSPAVSVRRTNPYVADKLLNKTSVDNIEWLCGSCKKYLSKNKVPPCAAINGMLFPPKPSFFDLNELECRLLAPRIAFQKIMQAPRGKQLKIRGNIVNVPADVINTVTMLPRLPNEAETIKIHLKRRLQYKSSALSLNVRPVKVFQAANWLVQNSSL